MKRNGFTLVEMMVVLTIILLLVALLTAAIDKAQYEASLTFCQTQLKAIGSGVITYASGNKQAYPYRPGVFEDPNWSPSVIADMEPNVNGLRTRGRGIQGRVENTLSSFDDRVALGTFLDVNKQLNCGLVKRVDLEDTNPLSRIQASQALWYGWRFESTDGNPEKGMFKLGDAFEWEREKFPILASDWTGFTREDSLAISSHPDYYDGTMSLEVKQNEPTIWWNEDLVTYSFWVTPQTSWPGAIDRVFTFTDGSVRRFTRVHWRAETDPEAVEEPSGRQKWQKIDDRTVRVPDRVVEDVTRSTHLPIDH